VYIRIQDNSIRYKISKKEADELIIGKSFLDSIKLSPHFTLSYQLKLTVLQKDSHFEYCKLTNILCLSINKERLNFELEHKPTKQGILFNQIIDGQSINISLEVNLKKARQ
jgi:hypothetical protein